MKRQNRPPDGHNKKSRSTVSVESYSDSAHALIEISQPIYSTTPIGAGQEISSDSLKTSRIVSKPFFPGDDFRAWYNQKCSTEGHSGESDGIVSDFTQVSPETAGQNVFSGEAENTSLGGSTFLINEHKTSKPLVPRVYENYLKVGGNGSGNGISERINRFEIAKKRSVQLQEYLAEIDDETASARSGKLGYCGSLLMFRDYLEYGESRLQGGMFCGQPKLCMGCAIRRSSKLLRDLVIRVTDVLYDSNSSDEVFYGDSKPLLPYLVTFTVRNGPDLSERYRHLDKAVRYLSDKARRFRNGQTTFTELCKSEGTFLSYEFKRGKDSGLWHPHCHCVWLCREAPNMYKLREEWFNITGKIPSSTKPSFQVDVRPFESAALIHSMAKDGCFYYDAVQDSLAGDLVEVCKYCLKLTDMAPNDSWMAFNTLFGKQMARKYGRLRGVKIDDSMKDIYESKLDGPYIDYLMGWNGYQNRYDCLQLRSFSPPKV